MANGVFGPEPGEPNPATGQPQNIQDIIAEVAREEGVPVELALAIAQEESGFDPKAVGDNGHSIGLFQLNDEGEGHGMTVAQREDPRTNAQIALRQVAAVLKQNPNMDWGSVAAAAQRPLDRVGYANSINNILQNGVKVPAASGGGTYSANTNVNANGGPVLDEQSLAAEYGFAASFFNSDPELKRLIEQATAQQWTPDKFKAEFQATNWYQTHSQSVRDFITLQTTDPATFNARVNQELADVKNKASSMGAQLDDATMKQIATNALEFGWDDNQLNAALGAHVSLTSGGNSADTLTSMKQYLSDMGINMADQTIQGYLRGIESGTSSTGDFQAQVRKLAQSAFPAYSQQIAAGQTVKDIADPYMQDMATILELNPANITLQDPTIRSVLTGTGQDGQPAQTGLWQFEQNLRKDPRWQYTKNATDQTYSMINTIGQTWGFL